MSQAAHILLVEDEEHLAFGIQFNLKGEGYTVTAVSDGPAALERLSQDDIDLVILDIMLPGMSGYAVCETLRESGSHIPILLLSARTLPEDRARGFDAGANQYLTKPFELTELLSRVKNLLTQTGRAPERKEDASTISIANAKVNFDTHEVTVDGEAVKMTPLELKLLRYFIDNAGRVIAREELLERVWEQPPQMNTRAPDQFIRRLRKIFEEDPSTPEIFVTIRDAGYLMRMPE